MRLRTVGSVLMSLSRASSTMMITTLGVDPAATACRGELTAEVSDGVAMNVSATAIANSRAVRERPRRRLNIFPPQWKDARPGQEPVAQVLPTVIAQNGLSADVAKLRLTGPNAAPLFLLVWASQR
jgi:hypothetical protein